MQARAFQKFNKNMSKRHSIAIILGGIVAYFLLVAFCLSKPLHQEVPDDPTVKGKGKDGECMDYALALCSRLAANGIHGRLIFCRWHIHNTAIQGSHVFVVYRLTDGAEWVVFLLSDAESDQVDVELQEGLNHLSYF